MAEERRQPCVGVESYVEANERGYYVDKTMFIRDLFKFGSKVNLITRPGGFGKTLNMDMLKVFFEKTEEDNSVYFTDKKIWGEEEYQEEQGKYPVVFMSFKGADRGTWDRTYKSIKRVIVDEYSRHAELKTSDRVNGYDLDAYNLICAGKGDPARFRSSLRILTRMLRAHYGVPAVVLIDDYDAPVRKGFDKAAGFMRDFLGNGLKTNFDVYRAVLTGVAPYAEVTAYHGLNNMAIHTVLGKKFSEYFGFTREEVQGILDYYGYGEKMAEVLEWYDGYDFGGREMFNPWSVMNYVKSRCKAEPYWTNTSSNSVIGGLLCGAASDTAEMLTRLLKEETVSCRIEKNIVFPDLEDDPDAFFTFLLFSGYLKSLGKDPADRGGTDYLLKIPNKETGRVFADEIAKRFRRRGRKDILKAIWDDIGKKDRAALEDDLCTYIGTSSTYYGTGEGFHHGLFLGLGAYKYPTHRISLEGESGDGRYDFGMEPLWNDPSLPAVIIEVKTVYRRNKDGKKVVVTPEELEKHAADARFQIDDKKYDTELMDRGFTDIIKLGIAFSGKNAKAVFDL